MNHEDFFSRAKNISLTPSERMAVRTALMEAATTQSPRRSFGLQILTFKGITSVVLSVFIITAVSSVGASYAAENAVPGDLLYPIKLHVNEGVRERLASSPEAAAAWEAEKADRRLREAETLVARSSLNATNKAFLRREFSSNVQAVRRKLVAMNDASEGADASDLRLTFSASLQAHSSVLQRLKESRASGGEDIDDLAEDVRSAAVENEEGDDSAEEEGRDNARDEGSAGARIALMKVASPSASPSETVSLGSLPEKVQTLIDETNALFAKRNASLSPATRALAKRKMEIASAALWNAQSGIDTPDEARQFAKTALRSVKEAELILVSKFPVAESAVASQENLTGALESERQRDVRFSTDARLEIADRKLKKVESRMESASGSEEEIHDSLPLQTHVEDVKQLMDIANTQMEEGNVDDALRTSGMALKRAKEAQDSLEKIREKQEEKQNNVREQEKERQQKEERREERQESEDD